MQRFIKVENGIIVETVFYDTEIPMVLEGFIAATDEMWRHAIIGATVAQDGTITPPVAELSTNLKSKLNSIIAQMRDLANEL